MQQDSKIFRLQGVIQHYNWGGKRFLPELICENTSGEQPYAEYWMGAHVNAPSIVHLQNGERKKLDQFLEEQKLEKLGQTVTQQFGRLPYLFKVLDVHDMLSIQVHPSKNAALEEFEKEEKAGIPLTAPHRNYKDDNHKPELMVALSEFYLLHGFKAPSQLGYLLTAVPELSFLQPEWEARGYEGIYRVVMELPNEKVNEILQPLIERVVPLYEKGLLNKWQEDFWAARAYKTFCSEGKLDRGLFSIYFFNIVKLAPGEAIFQDAGILHAYLEGQNLEIMANSDNVLRGGLTNKHVDVPELLKHVKFEPTYPKIILGTAKGEEWAFETPALDFELRRIDLSGAPKTITTHSADIFLLMEGTVEAKENKSAITLHKGETMLAINGANIQFQAESEAVLYHATVPL